MLEVRPRKDISYLDNFRIFQDGENVEVWMEPENAWLSGVIKRWNKGKGKDKKRKKVMSSNAINSMEQCNRSFYVVALNKPRSIENAIVHFYYLNGQHQTLPKLLQVIKPYVLECSKSSKARKNN